MGFHKNLRWVFFAIGINLICSWVPSSWEFKDPFWLYDITNDAGNVVPISVQAYVYMIAYHLTIIGLLVFVIKTASWLSEEYTITDHFNQSLIKLFKKFIFLEFLSLADFFIIYEHPWAYTPTFGGFFDSHGIEFSVVKVIAYAVLIIKFRY